MEFIDKHIPPHPPRGERFTLGKLKIKTKYR